MSSSGRSPRGRRRRRKVTRMSGTAVDAFDDSFDAMGQFTDTVAGDLRDPYPGLAEKRRTTPGELAPPLGVAGAERLWGNVYTYEECVQVLRDNGAYSSGAIRDLMESVSGAFVLVGL